MPDLFHSDGSGAVFLQLPGPKNQEEEWVMGRDGVRRPIQTPFVKVSIPDELKVRTGDGLDLGDCMTFVVKEPTKLLKTRHPEGVFIQRTPYYAMDDILKQTGGRLFVRNPENGEFIALKGPTF